ncbi:MAG TPA: GNAT family N-acetyltransferase [Burkholderiaceae bacterium]|nr:GNAT family N-acetyltransferase [Burkholderiaceae bacterium]
MTTWRFVAFDELTLRELYELLQLRTEVFTVEQNCVFQDIDGADDQAMHLLGTQNNQLVAYARCFPAGVKFAEASIGRVVTRSLARGSGLGHLLIQQAVSSVCGLWGPQPIRIGAQARLKAYYSGHGFVDVGVPYIEDGIDHLEMVWTPVT